MTTYTADDLWDDVDENRTFTVETRVGGEGELRVTHVEPPRRVSDEWAFEAVELTTDRHLKWRYDVFPNRGATTGGVVETYAKTTPSPAQTGDTAELYPKAFRF